MDSEGLPVISGLNNFTDLMVISIGALGITEIPDLTGLTKLYNIQTGQDQVTNIPDFSVFPDLSGLTHFKYLDLDSTTLTQKDLDFVLNTFIDGAYNNLPNVS